MAPLHHNIPAVITADRFLPGGVFTEEADGSHTMTERCSVSVGNVALQLPGRWSMHPQFSTLLRTTAQAIRQEGDMFEFQLRYQGIVAGLEPTVPEKQFYRMMSDEPIDTHKDFVTVLGGTASAPLNSAKFDRDGRFMFWPVSAAFSLGGIQTYKHCMFGMKLIYARLAPPSKVTQPTIVAASAVHYAPDLDTAYNYLALPPYWDQVGGYYRVTYEYLASGPRGWNEKVYYKP